MRRVVTGDKSKNLWKIYFKDVFDEDPENTIRFLLYLRDVRGGLGEREVFRNVISNMALHDKKYSTIALNILI
jgi:hypothetical protein